MSIKGNLILAAVVLSSASVYAGGPSMMSAPIESSFAPSMYVELGGGYSRTSYEDCWDSIYKYQLLPVESATLSDISNGTGGFGFAGDIGYEFMPHVAIELGGGYPASAKFNITGDVESESAAGQTTTKTYTFAGAKLSSWYAYAALRMDIAAPMQSLAKLDIYGKAGVAYRGLIFDPGTVTDETDSIYDLGSTKDHYWAPMFGVGASYDINPSVFASVEFDYIGGTADTHSGGVHPALSMGLVKVGYKLSM